MGIIAKELETQIVVPVLQEMGHYSPQAKNLLMGTAAVASHLGDFIQHHNGLSFGLYQTSTQIHKNVWDDYLAYNPDLASIVRGMASQKAFLRDPDSELAGNLRYATAIAWSTYLANGVQLPADSNDIHALAQCWKRYYELNSHHTEEQFIQHFGSFLSYCSAA